MENSMEFPQKIKNRTTTQSSSSTPVYLLKGSEIIMSIHCSIIYNSQDMEKTQMIIKRWMDKENVVDMQYYLATKKEILPCVTIQMDLEGIVLREISQTEKDKYYMISFMCGIQTDTQKQNSQKKRSDLWLLEESDAGVKRYKLPLIR